MDSKNLDVEDKKTPEQEIADAKLREVIKKYSCYSKIYPEIDWCDRDLD